MSLEQILAMFGPLMEAALGKYGVLVQVVTLVGALRLLMKPLSELIHTYVLLTPSKNDDLALAKVEGSKAYRILNMLLNYLASIKLPQ